MKTLLKSTVGFLWILIVPLFVLAETAQPTPMPGSFVHDFAGVISDERKAEIQLQAQRLKDEFKTEIAVVTIDSLQGEDSFDYSTRMARSWGIGSKENDVRGLLILVAVNDRKTAFRTSRHIEGELPDGVTGEISRRMNASFKNNDFGGGLSAGMSLILGRLSGVYEPQTLTSRSDQPTEMPQWFFVLLAILLVLSAGLIVFTFYFMKREKRAWIAAGRSEESYYESKRAESSSSSSSSSTSSGSSYSGGSDYGGGGSDSSW